MIYEPLGQLDTLISAATFVYDSVVGGQEAESAEHRASMKIAKSDYAMEIDEISTGVFQNVQGIQSITEEKINRSMITAFSSLGIIAIIGITGFFIFKK